MIFCKRFIIIFIYVYIKGTEHYIMLHTHFKKSEKYHIMIRSYNSFWWGIVLR